MLMSSKKHSCTEYPMSCMLSHLTVPYFFLWGDLKESIRRNRPHTIQEMKCVVWDENATINRDLLLQFF